MFSITVMSSFRYLQCQAETFNLIQNFFKSLFRIKKGDASVFKVHILGMSLQIFHKDLIFYSIFNTFSIKRNSFSAVVSISVQYSVSDPFKETVDIISSDPLFKKKYHARFTTVPLKPVSTIMRKISSFSSFKSVYFRQLPSLFLQAEIFKLMFFF